MFLCQFYDEESVFLVGCSYPKIIFFKEARFTDFSKKISLKERKKFHLIILKNKLQSTYDKEQLNFEINLSIMWIKMYKTVVV